jgi:hypothetical protein
MNRRLEMAQPGHAPRLHLLNIEPTNSFEKKGNLFKDNNTDALQPLRRLRLPTGAAITDQIDRNIKADHQHPDAGIATSSPLHHQPQTFP